MAAADALDCLTRPALRVIIPDMVYAEATRDLARLGASVIVDWVRAHPGQVEIAPTQVFAEFEALRTLQPSIRSQGRGEQAALEVLNVVVSADVDLNALLLFEDNDIRSRRIATIMPERVAPIATGEFLRVLESAGLIQSADQILDDAARQGRNVVSQREAPTSSDAAEAFRDQLDRRRTSDS